MFLNKHHRKIAVLESLNRAEDLQRDSNTSVFVWILRNFYEHFFYRTPPLADSAVIKIRIITGWNFGYLYFLSNIPAVYPQRLIPSGFPCFQIKFTRMNVSGVHVGVFVIKLLLRFTTFNYKNNLKTISVTLRLVLRTSNAVSELECSAAYERDV